MGELLVDLQAFADFRHVDLDEDDLSAQLAIDAASDLIRTLTGRTFDLVEDDEVTTNGTGTDKLPLPNAIVPVLEVSEVTVIDADLGETLLDAGDYTLGPSSILYRTAFTTSEIGIFGYGWPKGILNVRVVCTHGFEEIPADVQMAVLQLANAVYVGGQTAGQVIESETLGAYSVTYASGDTTATVNVPATAAQVISKYRLPSLVPPVGLTTGALS